MHETPLEKKSVLHNRPPMPAILSRAAQDAMQITATGNRRNLQQRDHKSSTTCGVLLSLRTTGIAAVLRAGRG
jgi:hypothetical protein